MKDKEFIQSIFDKISKYGDGELEFETRDIERLCNIALKAVPHVSDTVYDPNCEMITHGIQYKHKETGETKWE